MMNLLLIITRKFNAPCSRWWKDKISNSTGQKIDLLTSSAVYTQIIDQLNHFVNYYLSCIGLIFYSY